MPPKGWRPSGRCAIFVCDIVSFGRPDRHDRIQQRLREGLYGALRRGFDDSGVPFESCYGEDRGDGAILVPPPDIDHALLVHPLADQLRAELRRHNELAAEVVTIRLRTSLHVGEVTDDGRGLVGTAVNHVNRLLDAPQFKNAMKDSEAHFGSIVSDHVYETLIRPGAGLIDPQEYVRIEVQVKETSTNAWIRIPGFSPDEWTVVPRESRNPQPVRTVEPPPVRPIGSAETQPSVQDLFELVSRLLDVSIMATPEGRDQVVGLLRSEVAVRIRRSAQANLDTYAIVRTCLDYPGGLAELLARVRAFAGDSVQMRALEETIQRLQEGWREPPPGE